MIRYSLFLAMAVGLPAIADEHELPEEAQTLKSQRAKKVREIDQTYHRELEKLRTRYQNAGKLESVLAVMKEIKHLETTREVTPPKASAEPAPDRIFLNCDDEFMLAINGKVIAQSGGPYVTRLFVHLKKGDRITVKITNNGSAKGFACVVNHGGGKLIASGMETWKSYTPLNVTKWMEAPKTVGLKSPTPGGNASWKEKVESVSGTACESIWGHFGGDPAVAYLVLEIPG